MVTVTKYVWDPVFDCVSHELDENNDVKAVYHNEPQQYGGVLSQRRGTTSHYHHHDALGSTRFLTDSLGNVTDNYLNDAWGNLVASTGTTVNPFKWVGKYGYYTDDSTGQVYVRARMYQPAVARWKSLDPLFGIDSLCGYELASNSPILHQDPSGLLTLTVGPITLGKCGSFDWPIRWVPAATEREGWIIQEVEWRYEYYDCNGDVLNKTNTCDGSGPVARFETRRYWEIWYVTMSGAIALKGPIVRTGKNNKYQVPARARDAQFEISTSGWYDIFGFVNLVVNSRTQDVALRFQGRAMFLKGRTVPDGFVTAGGKPRRVYGSGALVSSCTAPKNWAAGNVVLSRAITRTWNCCCDVQDIGNMNFEQSGGNNPPLG